MKQFIIKSLMFFLPIFLVTSFVEYSVRKIPNDYSYKNDYLKKNAETIEVLVLGSSHSLYGINPAYFSQTSFNAAHVSQTLNYDYYIFQKFSSRFSNLKTVVLPISYFTLFTKLEEEIEGWRAKNYSIYYDCTYHYSPKYRLELCNEKFQTLFKRAVRFWTKKNTNKITVSDLGFGLGFFQRNQSDLEETGKVSSKRHTKDNFENLDENIVFLNKLISDCSQKKVNVFLYTPPAWHTYRQNLNKHQLQTMEKTISDTVALYANVNYVSFLDDDRFIEDDFKDSDHLNDVGAQKLTQIIDRLINPKK